MRFPFSRYVIIGNSMLPGLQPGQSVITINWFLKIKIGDVVVAKWGEKLIIKRVVEVKNDSFLLKGDNKDSTATEKLGDFKKADILGKVVY